MVWGIYPQVEAMDSFHLFHLKCSNSISLFLLLFLSLASSSSAIKAPLSFSSSPSFKTHHNLHQFHPHIKQSNMGLSPYSNPSDAGILCVILLKTVISISFMKEILRSILCAAGIRLAAPEEPLPESVECRGAPSETYMDKFRSRTPTVRYDSVSCTMNQECSVCLVEFKPEAEINRLSCGHVFHESCIEKWLRYWNITCPLCRNYMMAANETGENACPM